MRRIVSILIMLLVSIAALANGTLSEISEISEINRLVGQKQHQRVAPVMDSVRNSAQTVLIDPSVSALRAQHQFVLFYRASCHYCQRFDPILKQYSMASGIVVQAFTLDGVSLNSFPNSTPISQSIIDQYFGPNAKVAVPALFILNRLNARAYPVSSGVIPYLDLVNRINQLAPKIIAFERRSHA